MKSRSILFCVWRRLELRILFPFLGFRKGTAIFGSHVFNIEIADSPYRRMMGLSFRKGLDRRNGMLLTYPTSKRHLIWMMNMRFGIDILWLDKNAKVLHVVQNAPPARSLAKFSIYKPNVRSLYVLELKAGTATEIGAKKGKKFALMCGRRCL